jgi:transcriptional regulator with XRE-family HTH domain
MLVGEKIRKIRSLRGFTQEYMAQQLDMSQNNYSKIELGDIKITTDTLESIAKIFNLKPEDVLSFDEKYIFNNHSHDSSTANIYNANFGMADKERALFEELLKEKDAKIALMETLLGELKKK